jgi:hypothetical protein
MEMLLLLTGVIGLIGLFVLLNKNSKFDLRENEVYFHKKKTLIPYSSIISVEREISFAQTRAMYFGYLIRYRDLSGKLCSFRFKRSLSDDLKWDTFRGILMKRNPSVKINESVL